MHQAEGTITVVLLVEDETLVRMFAADFLRDDAGFKVVEAVNADEALTVLEATPDVRVLVTDVEMAGTLDGFALARLVGKAWPGIGIVVVSGRALPHDGDLPPGARFLSKPYSPAALTEAIRGVLVRGAEPIIVPQQASSATESPALPLAITLSATDIEAGAPETAPAGKPDE